MRARTLNTREEIKKQVERELEDGYERIFRQCADDLIVQFTSSLFWTMATRFGWGKKRLRELADALHDTEDMMSRPTAMNHRFGPLECEKTVRERYGIDLREEFKAIVEVKP